MGARASRFSFWLLTVAGVILIVWGLFHIIPTRMVVGGMSVYDPDSRTIITMEWVIGGMTFMFLGVLLVFLAPYVGLGNSVARGVVLLVVIMLVVMAIWSGATGARTSQSIYYKICPFVECLGALLALMAAWIRVGTKE
jgi:hypothetical protein